MKTTILFFLKWIGFFRISRFLIRKKLLILAYHGVEISDESSFSPELFIKQETLKKRMEYLKSKNFILLCLDEALDSLEKENLPSNSIVVTVDDGWYSTLELFHSILSDFNFPYTIYVTSDYVEKKVPVLNVVLRYLIWSSTMKVADLSLLKTEKLKGFFTIDTDEAKKELEKLLLEHFHSIKQSEFQLRFIKRVSRALNSDYKKIKKKRFLSLLSFSEIKSLSVRGVDIQLHTHTHGVPKDNEEKFNFEISENIQKLEPHVKNSLKHFCYPSGRYCFNCDTILKNHGICSATTCEPGFVTKETNTYFLPRFLDGENIPQIIFEAEVCGVLDISRRFRLLLKSFFNRKKHTQG